MIIDQNVKAEDVKEKTMKSLELMTKKNESKDSEQLQKTYYNEIDSKSNFRLGWK